MGKMKKRTISTLKAIFGSKKGKRHHSSKSSRSATPDPPGSNTPSSVESFRPIPRTPPPARVGPPPSPPVPTRPVAPVAPEPPGPVRLIPCAVCGRTFVQESLSKHVKICEKTAVKKRKTFDSSRQRREGTDLEQYLPKNFGLPENSPFLEKSPPTTAKVAPKPKPQTVRTTVMKPSADLQKCPHCHRAFGLRAFERHVEWCADKAKILPAAPAQPPQHIADAKQRLNARTQYKAPLARGRRSSQTRDKSSNSRSASVESSRGVSPPPPREHGDGRNRRTRASESMSSNDCYDEPSPHVPVIRNPRNSLNNSSGDANVKARQARLARDLSSTRLDDAYDPFASAARQMKELLSSDTDIPKKIHNPSKDLTRTLPILRPAKDKAPLSQLRTENSKMIKDTLNKTYQKTPTLQRMKSFGSTNNDNNTSSFGGRCSSFRLNRNDKKPSPKLNTTFTKSSKENISTADKTNFNRNNSLNRSFSSYTTSSYSTPKLKDKIPKIATSMYHSFQRTNIKQPVKLDKIKRDENEKKDFVNLDAILADDNSSMTDSNYIDPRLINENDNLPINVNTILNNPDIISSMESLLTTENLPSKFDSFSKTHTHNYESNGNIDSQNKKEKDKDNDNNNTDTNHLITAPVDNLSVQYDKIMSSLEESIASKTLAKDEESVFEEFDLEEFMTTFDEEIHKRKSENKRTCSSTTRVVRQSELVGSNRTSAFSSVSSTPKAIYPGSNGLTPVTNPKSFNFSSNNIGSENRFPTSVKRSTSLLDSIHKKTVPKTESGNTRHKSDQLEQDIMQSLKEFDKFYESEKNQMNQSNKDIMNYNMQHNGTEKASRSKTSRKNSKCEGNSNGNYTPNGKSSNDSAYSSLNRISPSKLSVCPKELNGPSSLERIPAGSDSSGSQKDEIRSVSSEEFLAMERSAELDQPIAPPERHTPHREVDKEKHEKRVSSHASSRRGSWRPRADLSSSSSEVSLSLHKAPPPRLSRFCHECGSRFPDAAKFCIECGVKRLAV